MIILFKVNYKSKYDLFDNLFNVTNLFTLFFVIGIGPSAIPFLPDKMLMSFP